MNLIKIFLLCLVDIALQNSWHVFDWCGVTDRQWLTDYVYMPGLYAGKAMFVLVVACSSSRTIISSILMKSYAFLSFVEIYEQFSNYNMVIATGRLIAFGAAAAWCFYVLYRRGDDRPEKWKEFWS